VGEETGITPDKLIRLIITGKKEEALHNKLVWQCVSCYTCGTRCPNMIQSGRITETLKKMTREENMPALLPNISYFHDSFVQGCTRWGRVNEMEFMGYYELKNILKNFSGGNFKTVYEEIKEQFRLGSSMFKQDRFHMKLHTSKGRKEVKNLYKLALKKKEALKKQKI
jgi:heterodisulfide reductase subunit C